MRYSRPIQMNSWLDVTIDHFACFAHISSCSSIMYNSSVLFDSEECYFVSWIRIRMIGLIIKKSSETWIKHWNLRFHGISVSVSSSEPDFYRSTILNTYLLTRCREAYVTTASYKLQRSSSHIVSFACSQQYT